MDMTEKNCDGHVVYFSHEQLEIIRVALMNEIDGQCDWAEICEWEEIIDKIEAYLDHGDATARG